MEGDNAPKSDSKLPCLKACCLEPFFKNLLPTEGGEYIFETNKCIGSIGRDLQLLPLEAASVFIKGVKQTTDMAKGLREHIGRFNSKKFYREKGIFDEATFESIDFEAVQMALSAKPKMYNLWYGKQCSGFCATG